MKAIVCVNKKMGIGNGGSIPWRSSKDMKHFKRVTIGKGRNAIVMGYTTFLSIGGKPLKGRRNYVLTRDPEKAQMFFDEDVIFESNVRNILLLPHIFDDVFIIGGEEIYKMFSKFYSHIYLTQLSDDQDCDKYFPIIDWEDYEREEYTKDKEEELYIEYSVFKRKKNIRNLMIDEH